jgi:hypothetical protein
MLNVEISAAQSAFSIRTSAFPEGLINQHSAIEIQHSAVVSSPRGVVFKTRWTSAHQSGRLKHQEQL